MDFSIFSTKVCEKFGSIGQKWVNSREQCELDATPSCPYQHVKQRVLKSMSTSFSFNKKGMI